MLKNLAFSLLFWLAAAPVFGCGFNFIGECSTAIFLQINGSADSFYVADCSFGTQFGGLDLGKIRDLRLAQITGATWESCQNNVSAMALFYRISPTDGSSAGAWQPVDLPQEHFTIDGPYTTRYRRAAPDLDLLAGLAVGQEYALEVYFRAEIDTIGDDFVPEIEFLQNNGGQNFHLTFTPMGVDAPPFTVVVTKKTDVKCAGDSTGTARVTVYGDREGLFYDWGNGNNWFEQFSLPAGIYALTVSGASGHAQTLSIEILAKSNLQNQMADLVPLGCDGALGSATATPSGGAEPYLFHWNTGEYAATGHFPAAGIWWLTVTDALGCTGEFFAEIPASGPVEIALADTICWGEAITFHGMTLAATGVYQFTFPGAPCDTLVTLTLLEAPPFSVSASGLDTLDCYPGERFHLSATASDPSAQFFWSGPSGWSATGPSVVFEAATLPAEAFNLLAINDLGCKTELSPIPVVILLNTNIPFLDLRATDASSPAATDGTATADFFGNYACLWSTGDTARTLSGLLPGVYCATVTDPASGCSTTDCIEVGYTVAAAEPEASESIRLSPNPASDFVKILQPGAGEIAWEIWSPTGQKLRTGTGATADLRGLPAGVYSLKINALGKISAARLAVGR